MRVVLREECGLDQSIDMYWLDSQCPIFVESGFDGYGLPCSEDWLCGQITAHNMWTCGQQTHNGSQPLGSVNQMMRFAKTRVSELICDWRYDTSDDPFGADWGMEFYLRFDGVRVKSGWFGGGDDRRDCRRKLVWFIDRDLYHQGYINTDTDNIVMPWMNPCVRPARVAYIETQLCVEWSNVCLSKQR